MNLISTTQQSIEREAALDQLSRLGPGMYVYASFLAVLALTTRFNTQHPGIFWGCTAAVALSIMLRAGLMWFGSGLYDRRPVLLRVLVYLAVALTTAQSGVLYDSSLLYYGTDDWTFTLLLIWTVAGGSGATISFTPTLPLLVMHSFLLFGQGVLLGLGTGGIRGYTFAAGSSVMLAFLMGQGISLHKTYWKQLEDRLKENARRRELEAAKAAADAANQAKTEFLANMSHEIRTPLHGILGMAQVALQNESNSESREYLEAIRGSGETLLAVLNEILDFSEVEAGKTTLELAPFRLRGVLEELRVPTALQANARNLALRWTVDEAAPEFALGDATRLRQVLSNLLNNALKFTPAGSIGLAVTTEENGLLRFQVSDTGIGIPPDQQKLIFQAFAQADASVTRRFGGTGLGLAISSRLVRLMGGELQVESTAGKGSVFAFAVPLQRMSAADLPSKMPDLFVPHRSLRILVAEDNLVSQRVATALLTRRGHLVSLAATGLEAVEACEGAKFDVILLDNQMPVMGGLDAIRRIRARETETGRARTPAIMLTASAMPGDRENFLESGMDAYLAKPFRAEELYETLAAVSGAGTTETSVK